MSNSFDKDQQRPLAGRLSIEDSFHFTKAAAELTRTDPRTAPRSLLAHPRVMALLIAGVTSFFVASTVVASRASAAGVDDFVTTWDTTNAGTSDGSSIRIPTTGGGYAYQVDWNNDGDLDDPDESTVHTGTLTHTFESPGIHTIRISGAFPEIRFNDQHDKLKLLAVDQWGSQQWRSMSAAFYGCTNLSVSAPDTPDLSLVTSTEQMFRSVEGTLEVGSWDTSSITNMRSMFWLTTSDLDVGTWNTGNVTDMQTMFRESPADPDVSNWDTSNVTNTSQMFRWATNADPAVGGWDTGSLATAAAMFQDMSSFTGDLGGWDTSSLQIVSGMFARGASTPNLTNFDTSNIIDFSFMFFRADTDPDVSNWDTSSAVDMNSVFSNAEHTNPDVSGWDTSNVTNMSRMFRDADLADPDMRGWNIENVPDMTDFLVGSSFSTENYDAALAAWATQALMSSVTFHTGNADFCDSGAERTTLLTTFSWTLIDGSQDCTPPTPSTGPDLADAFDTGHDADDLVTSLADVDLVVECTGSGNVVSVFWDQPVAGTLLDTGTCNGQLSASVTVGGLAEGTFQLTYSETKQGFESAQSSISTMEVDLTPPGVPVCVPTVTLVGIGDSFSVDCSAVEVGSILSIDGMLCTPSPTAAGGLVSCTGMAGPNSSPGDGEIDTSDDAVTVTDVAGNASTSSTGVTVDVEPPLIVRVGPGQVSAIVGETYDDAGATCTDDRDLSCSVVVGGAAVDTSTVGENLVSYDAVDSVGNAAVGVTRLVTVAPAVTTTSVPSATSPVNSSGGGNPAPQPTTAPTTTVASTTTASSVTTSTTTAAPPSTTISSLAGDPLDELDDVADAPFVSDAQDDDGSPVLWLISASLAAVAVGTAWWFLLWRRRDGEAEGA